MSKKAILELLSDGRPHTREDLHECCGPSSIAVVRVHVHNLRKELPSNEDIVCRTINGKTHYQHVLLLPSAYDGRH